MQTSCGVCHRPLSDPKSMKIGIGPICRTKGKTLGETMEKHADYKVYEHGGVICIEDLDKGNKSVTNDVDWVIEDVARSYDVDNHPVIYLDSMKMWDRLLVVNGQFSGFYALQEKDRSVAVKKALAHFAEVRADRH